MSGEGSADFSSALAWSRIVEAAVGGGAMGVVIAGDVFDSMAGYIQTRKSFLKGALRLKSEGIPIVAVAGNHDWEALPRFCQSNPDCGLTRVGAGGTWEQVEVNGVCYVGWSFRSERATERAFDTFPVVNSSKPIVGILHCDTASASYNKVDVIDFERGAMAWVLGHIHLPSPVGRKARYPGSPQALDFGPGERGVHGYVWLDISDGNATFSEVQPVSSVHFDEIRVSVDSEAGRTPLESLRNSVERESNLVRTANPHLESVNLRVHAEVEGWVDTRVDDLDFELVSVAPKLTLDLWREAEATDAASNLARLLIAMRALRSETYGGKKVDPNWISEARTLVERVATDVESTYRNRLQPAQDVGDAANSLDEVHAGELAEEAIAEYLERQLMAAKGVSA